MAVTPVPNSAPLGEEPQAHGPRLESYLGIPAGYRQQVQGGVVQWFGLKSADYSATIVRREIREGNDPAPRLAEFHLLGVQHDAALGGIGRIVFPTARDYLAVYYFHPHAPLFQILSDFAEGGVKALQPYAQYLLLPSDNFVGIQSRLQHAIPDQYSQFARGLLMGLGSAPAIYPSTLLFPAEPLARRLQNLAWVSSIEFIEKSQALQVVIGAESLRARLTFQLQEQHAVPVLLERVIAEIRGLENHEHRAAQVGRLLRSLVAIGSSVRATLDLSSAVDNEFWANHSAYFPKSGWSYSSLRPISVLPHLPASGERRLVIALEGGRVFRLESRQGNLAPLVSVEFWRRVDRQHEVFIELPSGDFGCWSLRATGNSSAAATFLKLNANAKDREGITGLRALAATCNVEVCRYGGPEARLRLNEERVQGVNPVALAHGLQVAAIAEAAWKTVRPRGYCRPVISFSGENVTLSWNVMGGWSMTIEVSPAKGPTALSLRRATFGSRGAVVLPIPVANDSENQVARLNRIFSTVAEASRWGRFFPLSWLRWPRLVARILAEPSVEELKHPLS